MMVERPSSKLQVALSSLVGIIVLFILALAFADLPLIAASFIGVAVFLGFVFLPLLWWRNKSGYIGAIGVGILSLVNLLFGVGDIATGVAPVVGLVSIIPGIVVAIVLVAFTAAAWREKA
ncbi:MAG: hypothetical protein ACE5KO_02980 [Candidatus Bathyarchaeia archaeon]